MIAIGQMKRRAKFASSACEPPSQVFVRSMVGTVFEIRSLPSPVAKRILVDEKTKILFCLIPKVASSNWRRVFLRLLGVVPAAEKARIWGSHKYIQKYIWSLGNFSRLEQEHRLKTYKKIMFVRDPLERLVSAYRNKLLLNIVDNKFSYVNEINRFYEKHRLFPFNRTSTENLMEKGITFNMFLQYLVDQSIVDKNKNPHYESYENLCEPCTIQYDYIGEFNDLEDDASAIFEELSIDMNFPRRIGNNTAMKTASIMHEYIKAVPKDLLNNILAIYSKDFQRYGYESVKWMK